MNWSSPGLACAVISGAILVSAPSCKRPDETMKADLGEAGYQMTTEDWFRAARENDVPALKNFVGTGFDFKSLNAEGDFALHAAAAAGAEKSADYLLSKGLSVDLPGALARTPLMVAVLADQTEMVRWLLRQGANPRLKDAEGFKPLMLAVREGKAGSVGELAAYTREDLDHALLLAALVGRTDVIETLTNFGASVYSRMEDGRTPLMIAAENGNTESVRLLLDIGSSRFTTGPEGKTAAELAQDAGHDEIAAMILKEPSAEDLALETPEDVAREMDSFVDSALAKSAATSEAGEGGGHTAGSASAPSSQQTGQSGSRGPALPLAGASLSAAVPPSRSSGNRPAQVDSHGEVETFSMPPIVMRHYREKEIPVSVLSVRGDTATLRMAGPSQKQVQVKPGQIIPGSNLQVIRVQRRMEDSKVSLEIPTEVSVVEVEDTVSGTRREWIAGFPSSAFDPVALVEDAATGQRYVASPGQEFQGADGEVYLVTDVRPNQMVIKEVATGAVQTIPLRGPRG